MMLYRYINWNDENVRSLLSNLEIYLYSPKKWKNDGELDFKLVNFQVEDIKTKLKSLAIHYCKNNPIIFNLWLKENAKKHSIAEESINNSTINNVLEYFIDFDAKSWASNPEKYKAYLRNIYFDSVGITSFSQDKFSFKLWNHKRNISDNNVVCIGFDYNEFSNYILRNYNDCILMPVDYSSDLIKYKVPIDNTGIDMFEQLVPISFTINSKFYYEKEIRLFRLLPPKTQKKYDSIIKLNKSLIKELIISEKASKDTIRDIERYSKEIGEHKIQKAIIDTIRETVIIL